MSGIVLQGITLLGNQKTAPPASQINENLLKQQAINSNINTNALKLYQNYKASQQAAASSGEGGVADDSGGGLDGSSDGGSSDGSGGSSSSVKSSMSKSERASIEKMKDSNVPYYYAKDENDLMYLASSEKTNHYWGLKEEVFVYTIHDRQKHRYLTSFNIDSDAGDICTTCQLVFPYAEELMTYWIPSKTTFMLMGGVFDREVLFIGRVSEINQVGQNIEVIGQNIGWKFKQYMTKKFYEKIQGLPVPLVVKAIFKELEFTEGKYHMDLWAIPNVFKYKLDEDATIKYNGETVQNAPELKDVVERMKDADINDYVAKRAKVRSTQEVADDYDKSVKLRQIDFVSGASQSYTPSSYRQSYGVKTSIVDGEISYDPLEDRIFGSNKSADYLTKDKSGYAEHTYEEVLKNIATAIDAQFFIVDTTVCFISFNSMMAMSSSEAITKAIQPRIEFWQMLEDSYELNVNQYGYYNTVKIKYKHGTLERSYDDLVRIYGSIVKEYNEPDLDYAGAQLKAQAYLAAHVRDFGMEVKISILHTGKITVGSFIKVKNPLTMSETLLYVYGITVQWDASGQAMIADLDLRYGPENPDGLEVPEYGLTYSKSSSGGSVTITGDVPADVTAAAQQMIGGYTSDDDKALAIYNWVDENVKYERYTNSKYSSAQVLSGKRANCYDTAWLIYRLCTAVGVKCEVWNGNYHFLDETVGHLWNKIYYQGKMTFADTGRLLKNPIGSHGGSGRYIVSQRCVAKNY